MMDDRAYCCHHLMPIDYGRVERIILPKPQISSKRRILIDQSKINAEDNRVNVSPMANTIEAVIYDAITSLIELALQHGMRLEKFMYTVMRAVVTRVSRDNKET